MKPLQLLAVIVSTLFFVSCQSSQTAGQGNQEQKRMAALQRQQQQPQPDESDQNLWNAQQDRLNRDSNPLRSY